MLNKGTKVPSEGSDPPTCHCSVTVLPLNYLGVILFDVG